MAWFDNTKTHEPYNNNFLLFCIFLSSIKMINLYIFILIFVAKCFYFFYYWRWYPYFITVYYFLATEKFSSLIFVSKNTFCCSVWFSTFLAKLHLQNSFFSFIYIYIYTCTFFGNTPFTQGCSWCRVGSLGVCFLATYHRSQPPKLSHNTAPWRGREVVLVPCGLVGLVNLVLLIWTLTNT